MPQYEAIQDRETKRFITEDDLIACNVTGLVEHPYKEVFSYIPGECDFLIHQAKMSHKWEVVPVTVAIQVTLTRLT